MKKAKPTQAPFWQSKTLAQMTAEEWESLCDGCGLCCLHKLEDEDSGEVYYTDVACRYLDTHSCRCSDYANRASLVASCLQLNAQNLATVNWLPRTCAYRLVAEGKNLFGWHPLRSGDRESVHRAKKSIRHRAVSETNVAEEDMEEHVVQWVLT